jgi:hypothetical protein
MGRKLPLAAYPIERGVFANLLNERERNLAYNKSDESKDN